MLKIKNWSSYQSYKDRRPPWIRFHKTMLDNYEYHRMSANARALLPMLWLLASEDEDPVSGVIRNSYESVSFRLRMTLKDLQSGIKECVASGFIDEIQPCNESVTKPYQDRNETVTPEAEANTKTDTETEKKKRVTLAELSVEHVGEWLAEKRGQGKYINHDEHFILEKFKDYCKSKGKTYVDYIAAYRNAFTWKECQPDSRSFRGRSQSSHDIAGRAWGAVGGINPTDGGN